MRHNPVTWLAAVLIISSVGAVWGQAQTQLTTISDGPHSASFSVDDLRYEYRSGYDFIAFEDGESVAIPGEPWLPAVPVRIAIPQNMKAVGVRVLSAREYSLGIGFEIMPAQKLVPISKRRARQAFTQPKQDVYSQATPYPGRLADCSGSGSMSGYRIAEVMLYPIQYTPSTGELTLYEDIAFEVLLEPCDAPPTTIAVRTRAAENMYRNSAAAMVINPEDLPDQVADHVIDSPQRMSGEIVEELIITTESMKTAFEPLVAWKTKKGVPTEVVTTAWIDSNYTGTDSQTRIRKCIQDYWQNKGVVWVILGGDTGKVACRNAYAVADDNGNNIPCDLYYSDLDGTWNADGDSYYGEWSEDDIDMFSDVYVGRFSADSSSEADRIVKKVLQYEASGAEPTMPLDYQLKILFLASLLNPDTDMGVLKNTIETGTPVPDRFTITKLYQSAGNLTAGAAINAFNAGYNLCNHSGHGEETGIQMGGSYMTSDQAFGLDNDPRFTHMYSMGCYSNNFTYSDCWGEKFQLATNGGGFYVGNSRYGFYTPGAPTSGPSATFDRYYWLYLFYYPATEVPKQAGAVFAAHKNQRVSSAKSASYAASYTRYVLYELNLMGDPETPFWLDTPGALSVSHPATIYVGGSDFTVTVTDGGAPVVGARVCLYKSDDVYLVDVTDAAGSITFHPSPSNTGTMMVTVTAPDYLPSETTAQVEQHMTATAPYGFINPGWVWISIPIVPTDPYAGSIFGDDNVVNKLFRWNPVAKNFELYPDDFTLMEVGRGYAIYSTTLQQPSYQGTPADSPFAIDIPMPGSQWFGCPINNNVLTDNMWVENVTLGQTRTAQQDYSAPDPWINWNFIWWNSGNETGGGDTADLCYPTFMGPGYHHLAPWYGYRLYANSGNLKLYVPGS